VSNISSAGGLLIMPQRRTQLLHHIMIPSVSINFLAGRIFAQVMGINESLLLGCDRTVLLCLIY